MEYINSDLIATLAISNLELEHAKLEIANSEKKFRALIENNSEAISLHDIAGNLLYQSPGIERIIGFTIEETAALTNKQLFHPDDLVAICSRLETAIKNPTIPIFGIFRMKHKAGHYVWVEGTTTNMLNDENVNAIVGNFKDITERKVAEEKIINLTRLYKYLSQINQTISHTKDEQTLFKDVCRIAIEIGKFSMAWIGMPDTVNKKLNIVANSSNMTDELELLTNIVYDEDGPTAKVLKSGLPYIINNFDEEQENSSSKKYALLCGYQAYIILPIKNGGKTIYTYNLFSKLQDRFDAEEIALLIEATNDISFAIDVFEKDIIKQEIVDQLLHSDNQLKQAQAIAHVGSWEHSFASDIGLWSDEMCRIYGVPLSENIQNFKNWLSFIHLDDLENVLQEIKMNTDIFKNSSIYHRIIRKDGAVRYIYSQSQFELDATGKPIGVHGVARDITEIKEARLALELSESNLHTILDLIPQCIFAKDYDGNFLFANSSFSKLYGLTPEELINQNMADKLPNAEEAAYFLQQDREVIDTGITKIIPETKFTDYKGKQLILHTTKIRYTTASLNKIAVLGISEDITTKIQVAEERDKIVNDIIHRNKALEQYSYIVSHNLRAPVANILGLVDLLQTIDFNTGEGEEIIDSLAFSIKKLDDVIIDLNQILQIKNTENIKYEIVSFSSIVFDIQFSISQLISQENVVIECDFTAIDAIKSVKSYLYSIFYNLISNSIKYRQIDKTPIITISSIKKEHEIVIKYKDNGLGFDLENKRGYVFGLYKRFHTHVQGKGMGLYMVKAQIESLGGTIAIESKLNKGTEFTIVFQNQ